LDINLYRDDLATAREMPVLRETHIPFDLQGKPILLIDDVLFTGRTIRSALDALIDLGRPKRIQLLVIVDRGGRELPIQADFCGQRMEVGPKDNVKVRLKEVDGYDALEVLRP
jgi:pyrimidine operon attenuation protein/uracil phosphoribosyltransferase